MKGELEPDEAKAPSSSVILEQAHVTKGEKHTTATRNRATGERRRMLGQPIGADFQWLSQGLAQTFG